MRPLHSHFRSRRKWLHAGIFCLVGCTNQAELELLPVRGRATLDGQPLLHGTVSLRPDGKAGGWQQPTGALGEDGQFVIYTQGRAGAPPGKYRVVVFATEEVQSAGAHPALPRSLVPERYRDPQRTPIRIDVQPRPEDHRYRLELESHES